MPQEQEEGTSNHPGNLLVVLNGNTTDDRTGDMSKVVSQSNGTESNASKLTESKTEVQTEPFKDPKQDETSPCTNDERAFRQGNWLHWETLVLLEAKRKEQDMCSGSRRSIMTADDKWKIVSDYCRAQGVQRSKEQCRFKWDNMLPDYRRIRDYEELKEAGEASYFELESRDRKAKSLPSNMDADVYQRINYIISNKPMKGGLSGLKREAREKKFADTPTNGGEAGESMVDFGANKQQITTTTTTRRRRKRRGMEVFGEVRIGESRNSSSTEEDPSSGRGAATTTPVMYWYDKKNCQRMKMESREEVLLAETLCQNGGQQLHHHQQHLGSTSPLDIHFQQHHHNHHPFSTDDKNTPSTTTPNGVRESERSAELLLYIEDRKDARHKELMALEREKLVVFRDASFAIANAMTNAMSVFSKVAEELLRRR